MSVLPEKCLHLTVEIVREIHLEAIARFGGSDGLRDLALLESAVAAPQASFGGKSPYRDIVEVAAAYLFHLCQNHPFIDGNKRVALGSCIVFLRLNGIEPAADGPEWENLTLDIAAGRIDRDQATKRLRRLLPKTLTWVVTLSNACQKIRGPTGANRAASVAGQMSGAHRAR